MKKNNKNWIKGIAFILLFAMLFSGFSYGLQLTDSVNIASIKGFYKEPKNTLDVVLLGASEVYSDYCATSAWKQFGYTSYSLGVSGVPGSLYKSMLNETITSQKPKLIVFEINGFLQKDSYYERLPQMHGWIDNIKSESNKKETIASTIPKDSQIYFNLPFLTYHSNWKNLAKCFENIRLKWHLKSVDETILKGYASYAKESDSSKAKVKKLQFTRKSKAYLTELLDYCKDNHIDNVLFARFPHSIEWSNQDAISEIKDLVTSYGYDFKDFDAISDQIMIENGLDYYNSEHLNINGSQKFTNYLGNYLRENYALPPKEKHSKQTIRRWNKCVKKADAVLDSCYKDTKNNLGIHYYELLPLKIMKNTL